MLGDSRLWTLAAMAFIGLPAVLLVGHIAGWTTGQIESLLGTRPTGMMLLAAGLSMLWIVFRRAGRQWMRNGGGR